MKMDLCSFCLKSGILCQKCSAKVKAGEITDLDLRIARLLLSVGGEISFSSKRVLPQGCRGEQDLGDYCWAW